MALIDFYIRNQKLSKNGPAVVADAINYVDCSFTFKTRDWDGLDKWLLLEKDETYYEVNLINDAIPKEPGLTIGAGIWHVSLFGIRADGTRITTDSVTLEVKESAIPEGGPLPVIGQTAAEQIAAKAEEAFAMASAVKAAADSGKFNGKDGAPGTPGEQGIPGTPGERGERGLPGIPGKDGYSPQIELSQFVDNLQKISGAEIKVINKDGSFSVVFVYDGKNGEKGEPGISPEILLRPFTDEDGKSGIEVIALNNGDELEIGKVYNGEDGKNATPEQIAEAVENYFEENPIPGGGGGNADTEDIEKAVNAHNANENAHADLFNNKVNVSDIANNLTTNASNKPLSAAQGVKLKEMIQGCDDRVDEAIGTAQNALNKNEVHIGADEPSDPNAKIWIDPNEQPPTLNFTGAVNDSWNGTESKTIEIPEGGVGTDKEIVAVLIETDMLPAIYDESGILCDENRNVILRY